MAQTKSKNQSAFISILRSANNLRTGKTFQDGRKQETQKETFFTRELVDVTDFTPEALDRLIYGLSSDHQASIILGELTLPPADTVVHGKPVPPGQYLRRQVYLADPDPWVRIGMVDFDSHIYMDDPTDPDEALAKLGKVVPALDTVSCTLHFSSSAGVPEMDGRQILKTHVWVVLDRPVRLSAWHNWLLLISNQAELNKIPKDKRPKPLIDHSLGRRIQVHYTADPKFIRTTDPFAQCDRVHWIAAEDDALLSADLIEAAPVYAKASSGKALKHLEAMPPATEAFIRCHPVAQHEMKMGRLLVINPEGFSNTICVWWREHSNPEILSNREGAGLIIHPNGDYAYHCQHTTCSGRTTRDYRKAIAAEGASTRMIKIVNPATTALKHKTLLNEVTRLQAVGVAVGDEVDAVVHLCRVLMAHPETELADLEEYLVLSPVARNTIEHQWHTREEIISPVLRHPDARPLDDLADIDVTEPGITIVHSGCGTGKTMGSEEEPGVGLRAVEASDFPVAVTPRVVLTKTAANNFGMHYYDDIKNGIHSAGKDGLAVTVLSLAHHNLMEFMHPAGKNYRPKLLIIDELHSLLGTMATRSLMGNINECHMLYRFTRMLQDTPKIIILDADVTPHDIDLVKKLSGRDVKAHTKREELGTHPDGSKRSMRVVSDDTAQQALRDGTVKVVVCDGLKYIKLLAKQLRADGVKVEIVFTSQSKKHAENLAAAITRAVKRGGLVLLSPAADTGISVIEPHDLLSKPGAVLYIITQNMITPEARRQSILRTRAATEIWVLALHNKVNGPQMLDRPPTAQEIQQHAMVSTKRDTLTPWDEFAAERMYRTSIARSVGVGGFFRFMHLRGVDVQMEEDALSKKSIAQHNSRIRQAGDHHYQVIFDTPAWTYLGNDGKEHLLPLSDCYDKNDPKEWQPEIEKREVIEMLGREPRDVWEVSTCIASASRVRLRMHMYGLKTIRDDIDGSVLTDNNTQRQVDTLRALLAAIASGGDLPNLLPLLTAGEVKKGDKLVKKALKRGGYAQVKINGKLVLTDTFVRIKQGERLLPGRAPLGADGVDLLDTVAPHINATHRLLKVARTALPLSAFRDRDEWLGIIETCLRGEVWTAGHLDMKRTNSPDSKKRVRNLARVNKALAGSIVLRTNTGGDTVFMVDPPEPPPKPAPLPPKMTKTVERPKQGGRVAPPAPVTAQIGGVAV